MRIRSHSKLVKGYYIRLKEQYQLCSRKRKSLKNGKIIYVFQTAKKNGYDLRVYICIYLFYLYWI